MLMLNLSLKKAIESGITYFDTADIYDKGTNEEIVGKAFKKYQNRDDIVIGTKVGNRPTEDGEVQHGTLLRNILKKV